MDYHQFRVTYPWICAGDTHAGPLTYRQQLPSCWLGPFPFLSKIHCWLAELLSSLSPTQSSILTLLLLMFWLWVKHSALFTFIQIESSWGHCQFLNLNSYCSSLFWFPVAGMVYQPFCPLITWYMHWLNFPFQVLAPEGQGLWLISVLQQLGQNQ